MIKAAFHTISLRAIGTALAAAMLSSAGIAQDTVQDDQDDLSEVIVTGTRIRQGGAQDIRHFRSVSLDGSFLPQTSDLTIEGLMGEHDLTLTGTAPCKQMFCLTGHAMPAALPTRPQDRWFIGLGFDSNIDAESWQREPLSLIAVVDRSGSMTGEPMARVKEGLHAVLGKMRKGDRLGIVIYGSDTVVHLAPTDIEGNREAISRAIDAIAINGSTYMEAGLKLGYQTAYEELARSHGKTRLMLFTDENPNVGNVSPEGFMGMAEAASRRGVGLTTIGVGVHFDAALATKVSSVRGGNLFFLDRSRPARELYDKEFFNMVSEVAHDIVIAMTPPEGWRISGVFGVPDALLSEAPEGTVTVKIGSAFLSSDGGGIYASLAPDKSREHLPAATLAADAPLLRVSLSYADALSGKSNGDRLAVAQPVGPAPENLATAQLLVDEYLSLTGALKLYHQQGDKKGAFHMLDGLAARLGAAPQASLAKERTLVAGLRDRAALVAGYAGEVPKELKPLALLGKWRVMSQEGLTDIARGDLVEITDDEEFITHRNSGRAKGDEVNQDMAVNEREILLRDVGLRMSYRVSGDQLTFMTSDGQATLRLQRLNEEEEQS